MSSLALAKMLYMNVLAKAQMSLFLFQNGLKPNPIDSKKAQSY